MESPNADTPTGSLYTLAAMPSNVTPVADVSLNTTHRSKTNFRFLPSKVIEDAQVNDIQLDIENDEINGYFDQDPEERSGEVEEGNPNKIRRQNSIWAKKECNSYEIYFKPGVFFQFFLMHVIFHFVTGPLIGLLSPIFGKHVLRNQGFIGFNFTVLRQSFEAYAIIFFLVIFYTTKTAGLEAMEVYMMAVAVLVRFVTIACKYAYQSEYFIKLLYTKTLTKEDLYGEILLSTWRKQSENLIEEEIKTALVRLEIDRPLFFFSFLGRLTPELKEKLSNKKNDKKVNDPEPTKNEMEEEYPQSLTSRRTELSATDRALNVKGNKEVPDEYRLNISGAERKRSSKRTLLQQTTIWENKVTSHHPKIEKIQDTSLSGFNLAFELIKSSRCTRFKNLGKFCMLLSIIRALLPTFYRAYRILEKNEDIPFFTDKPYVVAIIFFINFYFFYFNVVTIIVVIEDIRTKISCLKQIGYLISPKKLSYFQAKKLYPTLNIFDPVTLKTWSNLRKLMNDYGKVFIQRNNFNVTVTMSFYSFVIVILVLQMLGVFTSYNNPLLFIVFAYESLVFFAIFAVNLWGAAFVNDQYKVHKNLLKKNKTIISDFQRLSNLYVGEHAIEPDNPIYKEGLKLMKQELGEENFEKKLVARAEKLTYMIDDTIEELDFEEENEPFTVMGIIVDYSLIRSLMVGVASLVFAISQSYLN